MSCVVLDSSKIGIISDLREAYLMELYSIKNTIQEIAGKHEFYSISRDITEKFSDESVSIALVGEYSSGKSTITNALLGTKMLPSFEEPTTAAIVEVVVGPKLSACIMADGQTEEIELADTTNYIVEKHENVEKVIITTPENAFLAQGMKIIDTPGIDSIENTHQDITFGYLPFVDAILLVININKGGITASLRTFLTEKIIDEHDLKKVYILLNWADTKSQREIEMIKGNVLRTIAGIIPEPVIIPLSGKLALEGDIPKSNINELKEALHNILASKKEIVDARLSKFLSEKRQTLIQLLHEKLSIKDFDDSELQEKISDSKKKMAELEEVRQSLGRGKKQLEKNINYEIDRLIRMYCNSMIEAALEDGQKRVNDYAGVITNQMNNMVDREIAQFELPLELNKENDVAHTIKTQINIALSGWRETINTVSPLLTAAILAAFTGPTGIAASELSLETIAIVVARVMKEKNLDVVEEMKKETKDKEQANNQKENGASTDKENDQAPKNESSPNETNKEEASKTKKGLKIAVKTASNLIAKLDLANKGMKYAVHHWKKKEIQELLSDSMKSSIGNTLTDLFRQVDHHLNLNVIQPQKELEKILEDTREERKNQFNKMVEIKKEIEKDMNQLNLLL